MSAPEISVVVPVYNSVNCLDELVRRLTAEMDRMGRRHEIILVNDGSQDGSWEKICTLTQQYGALRGVGLRRNFGQDNAIMAGLAKARGDIVVVMDDDLQHDPADVEKLINTVEAGNDVCYANFRSKNQKWWKNAGSWFNDKVANLVIGKPSHVYLSPFKAISRAVVREVVEYEGPFPYIDGLLFRVTRSITQVDVQHGERFAGKGNYSLRRSIGLWLKVATGFSLLPLRLATVLGFTFSILGLFLAVYYVIRKITVPEVPIGWASTITTVLVLGGVQLACLGFIGEYLGRVFLHLNKQPQYIVGETTGSAAMPSREEQKTVPGRHKQ